MFLQQHLLAFVKHFSFLSVEFIFKIKLMIFIRGLLTVYEESEYQKIEIFRQSALHFGKSEILISVFRIEQKISGRITRFRYYQNLSKKYKKLDFGIYNFFLIFVFE